MFEFEDASLKTLETMTQRGNFPDMAGCVKSSLKLSRVIQQYREQGFTDLYFRNPKTGTEIKIIL